MDKAADWPRRVLWQKIVAIGDCPVPGEIDSKRVCFSAFSKGDEAWQEDNADNNADDQDEHNSMPLYFACGELESMVKGRSFRSAGLSCLNRAYDAGCYSFIGMPPKYHQKVLL